jgi:hypothetical protein
MKQKSEIDPKALIYEAFRIDEITPEQCRSIFLDWALSLPAGQDTKTALKALIANYGVLAPDHPMTQILRQGLSDNATPHRRGGWRARQR